MQKIPFLAVGEMGHIETHTFTICEDFHSATEHGLEHGILLGQGLHGGVMQRSSHIKLDVLAAGVQGLEIQSHLGYPTPAIPSVLG